VPAGRHRNAGASPPILHDLQGTTVARLAIAGATVPQIATFTGHSLAMSKPFSMRTISAAILQLAEAAVLKLEARTKLYNEV
jgi:hypothetical protein